MGSSLLSSDEKKKNNFNLFHKVSASTTKTCEMLVLLSIQPDLQCCSACRFTIVNPQREKSLSRLAYFKRFQSSVYRRHALKIHACLFEQMLLLSRSLSHRLCQQMRRRWHGPARKHRMGLMLRTNSIRFSFMFRVWGMRSDTIARRRHTRISHILHRNESHHKQWIGFRVDECICMYIRGRTSGIPNRAKWFNQNIYILELRVRRMWYIYIYILYRVVFLLIAGAMWRMASCYVNSRISCETLWSKFIRTHARTHTLSLPESVPAIRCRSNWRRIGQQLWH